MPISLQTIRKFIEPLGEPQDDALIGEDFLVVLRLHYVASGQLVDEITAHPQYDSFNRNPTLESRKWYSKK